MTPLLILDVIIPYRAGAEARTSVGIELLDDLCQDPRLRKPPNIVGVTTDSGAFSEAHQLFARNLWFLLRYGPRHADWHSAL
jgi:hypothetical protein